MPALRIGGVEIAYEVRRSATTSERRITVTPGCVEVLALTTDDHDVIESFLGRKRQWLFDTVREMERVTANRHAVPGFLTGSKIPYRGRRMPLTVRRSDGERIEIAYRNGFIVDLPSWAGNDTGHMVASELKLWLKQRVRRDVTKIAGGVGERFGFHARGVRVTDLAESWGSCGPEGNILINWHLIFAPKAVLEYVVVHELAHLKHRSHGREYWDFLRFLLPDFERPKAWLEAHFPTLNSDFLAPAAHAGMFSGQRIQGTA